MIPSGTTSRTVGGELSDTELAAWRGMLRVTHRVRQELGADLARRYGLTMADYDALVTLAAQPDGALRMTALADAILQPRSSVTRIVGSLEERGLVRRSPTSDDGRGASAELTSAGRRTFARAHRTHLANVRRLFLDRLTPSQLRALAGAWRSVDPSVLSATS